MPIVGRPVVILNLLGLHPRPADRSGRPASQFTAEIRVDRDGQAANLNDRAECRRTGRDEVSSPNTARHQVAERFRR
jgi:hypothetical protein